MAFSSRPMALPQRVIETASKGLRQSSRRPSPARIAGGVAGALALFAFAYFLPDLIRYIKLKRM